MGADDAGDRLAGTWFLNRMHSVAEISIPFVVTVYRSRFDDFDASIADGGLRGEVRVDSLVLSEDHGFRGHVLSPEFFDVAQHPTISFSTTELRLHGDRVELDGELTIRGVTRPIQATGSISGPVDDATGHRLLGFSLHADLDRTAYGLTWNMPLPSGLPTLANDVRLTVELEFMHA